MYLGLTQGFEWNLGEIRKDKTARKGELEQKERDNSKDMGGIADKQGERETDQGEIREKREGTVMTWRIPNDRIGNIIVFSLHALPYFVISFRWKHFQFRGSNASDESRRTLINNENCRGMML